MIFYSSSYKVNNVFFRLLCLCSVKMAYRALEVEGHVLPSDNKRHHVYFLFVYATF